MYRTTTNMNNTFEIVPKKKVRRTKPTFDIGEIIVPIPDNITSKKKKFKIIDKEKKKLTTTLRAIKNPNSLSQLLQNVSNEHNLDNLDVSSENSSTISDISDITIEPSFVETTEDNIIDQSEEIIEVKPKQKRNSLCLCGSGKKYKLCCLNCEHQLTNTCDDCDSVTTSLSINPDNPVRFTERQLVTYPKQTDNPDNDPDEETIELQVQAFNANYKIKLKPLKTAHINQKETAKRICDTFSNKEKVIQLVISRTQTGKTGCMIEFINQYINTYNIPINHIFIIANISSKDWMNQTKQRVPQSLEKQIFHLPQLNSDFRQSVEGKKNILIIVDEAHCAALKQQTLSKLMSTDGMDWNLDTMLENDIKLVQYSATPDGLIFGYKKKEWPKSHYEVHIMKEGQGYYGISQMLQRKDKVVLKQAKDLSGKDKYGCWKSPEEEANVNTNISELFDDIFKFTEYKYSIIRCHGLNIDFIRDNISNYLDSQNHTIKEHVNHEFRTYTEDGDISKGQIDELLKIKPEKHTIILIKEMLKCSNTLHKTHLGVVYERCTAKDINDSFIIQGLLGRITGYGVHDIVCYTNLESIEKYEKLFKNNFDNKTLNEVQWNSNTTKTTTKGTKGRETYIDPVQILTKNTKCKIHGIPIRIDFMTVENHNNFFTILKNILDKKRKTKDDNKIIHSTLLDLINQNIINVSTHEGSKLHSEIQSDMNLNIYNFFKMRTLKVCRIYKHGDITKSRRFKSWNNAYLSGKPDCAQSGNGQEYSIDMCKDNWEYSGVSNNKTVAWISYQEE